MKEQASIHTTPAVPSLLIECSKDGEQARQLARATANGLLLYCRECHHSHLVSWQQLEQIAAQMQPAHPLEQQPVP